MSTIKSAALIYRSFGDPNKVLELSSVDVPSSPSPGKVLVRWLASPINPLDINRIEGNYAVRAELPAIGGSEGVGRVVKVGAGCSSLREGDMVTLFSQETPFWTEYGEADEADLFKIDNRINIETAATLMVNPPTAWVMLRNFVKLEKGDYVIQNAANSGVGRAVIQLCKVWGIKTINLVRNRESIEQLKTELWRLGADHVFTEEEFKKSGREFIGTRESLPRLALNGVGGRSSLAISATLERGGTCIVYGGMSKKPHEFSTSALVFNDINVRGVAIGFWMRLPENQKTFENCMKELQELFTNGKIFAPPMDKIHLDDYKTGIQNTLTGRRKQILILQKLSKL